jgi:hypothetical protein
VLHETYNAKPGVHRYTRKRASFPAVFLYGTGTPRSWVEVREQELVIASFAA